MLCDKEHPENQPVKYITKKPPTYNSVIEDSNGKISTAIKGLSDTCDLLSDPMLETLKVKLKECLRYCKNDDKFDYDLYEDTFKAIRHELNKVTVKKALRSVLQNDVLQDIEMKISLEEMELAKK